MARRKNVLPRTKSPEEWEAFFNVIDVRYPTAARNHALFYLSYLTGLRVGEALSLHVEDLDFDRLKLRVRDGKSGERIVPLPDSERLRQTTWRWLAAREKWAVDTEKLFVTANGNPLRASAVRRSMALYAKRAGIGHATPHQLRHSCASELLGNGASALGVSRVLGHKSVSTTLNIYAHAADRDAQQAMLRRFGC